MSLSKAADATLLAALKEACAQQATTGPEAAARFFKTSVGSYGAHDAFLGVPVPTLRAIAKQCRHADVPTTLALLQSCYNEERLLALFLLIQHYQKAEAPGQQALCGVYLENLAHVNNWNLVDSSAHLILGHSVWERGWDPAILPTLARSDVLWERRVAIVATWHGIRRGDLQATFDIALQLLHDPEDLLHKAVGWMLREAGKKDPAALVAFLEHHAPTMPRTMLRYALERCTPDQKTRLMGLGKGV